MYLYNYKVVSIDRIVDGDTVDLTVDLGFSILIKHRFRLEGFDAPETWRPKSDIENTAGISVTGYLTALLKGYERSLFVKSVNLGIYGRYGAELYAETDEGPISINEAVSEFLVKNKITKPDIREQEKKQWK